MAGQWDVVSVADQPAKSDAGGWNVAKVDDAPPAPPSHLERIGAELMQPVIGLEQLAGRVLPIPAYEAGKGWVSRAQSDSDLAANNAKTIQAARGGNTGVNWEQMGLDTVNPVNYVGGPAAKALGVADRFVAPVAGAVAGMTSPVDNPKSNADFWRQKAEQAAIGGAGGKASELLGSAMGVALPAVKGSAKVLTDMGVRLTPGQMAGGIAKTSEDKLTSVPVMGDLIQKARVQSVHDFNRAAINEGLKEIGLSIPQDVKAGRDALNFMHEKVTGAYNRVMSHMTGTMDPGLQGDLVKVGQLGASLPPEDAARLKRVIINDVVSRFSQGGKISGQAAQEIGTNLDNQIDVMMRSESPDTRRLGTALREIDASLNRMLDRQNPVLAPEKQKIDAAYAHYKTIERASASVGADDGVFTPSHLLSSIKARDPTKDKSSYARGNAMMQELAQHAKNVIPSKVPDSGTAGRGALLGGLTGGAALAYEKPVAAAGAAAALGAGSAIYTKPGQAASRWLMNPGATRQALGAAGKKVGRAAAPVAGKVANSAATGISNLLDNEATQ